MSNAENGLNRHLSIKDSTISCVRNNLHNVALLHVLVTDYELVVDGDLLECLLIHEDTTRLVLIEILVRTTLNDNVLELLTNVETTLQYATV